MKKECFVCGCYFETNYPHKRTCNESCRIIAKKRYLKKWRNTDHGKEIEKENKKKYLSTERGRKLLRLRIKKYDESIKGKINKKKKNKKYNEKYPEKIKSRAYANNNKQIGDNCENCDVIENLEFHHTNYFKNEGITLCVKCHRTYHGVKIYA